MNRGFIKCVLSLGVVALVSVAEAHPYASGITNSNGLISWVLNETASDVKIVFDDGATIMDYGPGLAVGTNVFTLGAHTNFSIVVFKVGSNVLNQISSDANIYNNFHGPRGVAVNKNPKTWNFGRTYVANANPGSAGPMRPVTTKGIYVMDAASEDCLGLGNVAATAGITLGSSTTFSPYKLFVGPDDALYVGDAATGIIGGVWRVDADLKTSATIFGLANPGNNTTASGVNFGRAAGTPNVTGSLANSNLVLTLTAWDLNLVNPPGTFSPTATGYQNIYRYNIGAGPLPWSNFPTVVTNPIRFGNINSVVMDVQIAPDGKYFITAKRNSPSDGTTNVCVLDSTGTTVLWDSKTQSAAYFGDTVNDHLSIVNYSISVSPDDKFVLIQGAANNNFLLMSLTNGIPDISTLTTNTTVGTGGGSTCYASTWDAADNIYVSSGGSGTLRIFSPGMTTTCITSNDATCTNGSFQLTTTSAALAAIQTQPTNQTAQCSGNASFFVGTSGVGLKYQWYLAGTGAIGGATNSVLTLSGVSMAQSGSSYTVIVSNTLNSVTSQVAVLTVTDTVPPIVTLNGSATISLPQGTPFIDPGATAMDSCAGSVPVTMSGTVDVNSIGTYHLFYLATDPSGNSATNSRTVVVQATNGPPFIEQQPSDQIAQCTSPVVFSVIAAGAAPLSYQWYNGALPLSDGAGVSGSSTATLTLSGTLLSQAGSYSVVITNSLNSITSRVATLTVSDTTIPTITVIGNTVISMVQGSSYIDPGATAADACVGSLAVSTAGSVDVNTPGRYVIVYAATNSTGNSASAQRIVTITPIPGPITAGTPNIIPLPATLQNRPGVFSLCPSQPYPSAPAHALMQILVDNASQATGQYLAAALFKSTGYQFRVVNSTETNAVKGAILITTSNAIPSLGTEGYELTVAPDSVVIRAPAQGGTFYGVQSLLQLLPPQIYSSHIVSGVAWTAPCVYIQDQPRFPWRGVMLDVARHFFNKDEVKQVLDAMAMHKLNTFHWHLVDDQGWRLEITNYPNLTVAGAFRSGTDYGLPPRAATATNAAGLYGGFYTQAEAREIVAYAQERHITVVPEIEMPCHVTCALAAYPQFGCGNAASFYNPDYPSINYGVDLYSLGTPATLAFLQDVLDEVMGIFPGKYIHCGGDEVVASGDRQWNTYSADVANMASLGITPNGSTSVIQYQHWFSSALANYLQTQGRMMMGWTEIENGGIVTNAALMDWQTGGSSQAVAAAEAGQPVVMTPDSSCYINYVEGGGSSSLKYEPPFVVGGTPSYLSLSQIYAFNPVPATLPSQYGSNILGAQCNLFGEYVPSFRNVMFKMFPRVTALAEITWTPQASQSFSNFTNRLVMEEQRYTQMGVNYDHETLPQIGTWGPTVSTSSTTNFYDITTNVTSAGEIDVSFWYTSGANLAISSVALLVNGVQVDVDAHAGLAEPSSIYQATKPFIPVFTLYVLQLPAMKPGATYTIQTVTQASGGTTASGTIYLPNWN
ncbi:family 20 glycosylhydrolase [Pedosphaera parvula]|uniref:beta-N-acetylhexosaminidase n=1 Tax=Pedosphaera parvula (strain Ellin514) TaxID=320771 RepID=B9XAQ8_PEDPL|nr:family 20 glycosylhydrolase [Pedosphaera parvula]EEF63093.1 Beta-N-acetylhexosaminidase [Pedosphaera parvula Ellin514]